MRVVSTTGVPCLTGVATYPTIQAAISAAGPGDVVAVCPGTYVENFAISTGKDGLTLVSVVPQAAILENPGLGNTIRIFGGVQNVQVLGFTFTGTTANNYVFVLGGASAIIDSNTFRGVAAIDVRIGSPSGAGSSSGSAIVTNNTMIGYGQAGILVNLTGSTATIQANQISATDASGSGLQIGVQVGRGATALVEGNQLQDRTGFSSTTEVDHIIVGGSAGTVLRSNRIAGGDRGIWLTDDTGILATGNTVSCNVLTGGLGSGTGILVDAPETGNSITDNTVTGWGVLDLTDLSTGTLSCCTANNWLRNTAQTDNKNMCLVRSVSTTCTL